MGRGFSYRDKNLNYYTAAVRGPGPLSQKSRIDFCQPPYHCGKSNASMVGLAPYHAGVRSTPEAS